MIAEDLVTLFIGARLSFTFGRFLDISGGLTLESACMVRSSLRSRVKTNNYKYTKNNKSFFSSEY